MDMEQASRYLDMKIKNDQRSARIKFLILAFVIGLIILVFYPIFKPRERCERITPHNIIIFSQTNQYAVELPAGEAVIDGNHEWIVLNKEGPKKTSKAENQVIDQCSLLDDNSKFDCNPDEPINQKVCESRGCCWKPSFGLPPLNIPSCYFPKDYEGYQVDGIQQDTNRALITLQRNKPSGFSDDVDLLYVDISAVDNERLRIRIYDPSEERYEVPLPFFNISGNGPIDAPLFLVNITKDGVLKVSRKSTGTVVFHTDFRALVFADQFIQLSSLVPSTHLFGLGEHQDTFRKELTWRRYTMFNRDQPPAANVSLYGSYPFYLMVEDKDPKKNAHGVFLLNSNAMDVILQPTPAITWRTIGGILDFFIFMGPSAPEVVRQNVGLIGKPVMQPYWSLGFHLCRFGYSSVNKTRETTQRTIDAGIPLDVQWNDIDYMDKRNDFTYDQENFKELPEFVDNLHSSGRHYVVIIDAGVSASEKPGTYPPWDDGVSQDIFVKNSTGDIFIGKVWNRGSTAWPDFTHPKAIEYWSRQFSLLYEKVKFDGAWIDMNEPSNFFNGQKNGCPNDTYERPRYFPGGIPLQTKTMCMTAQHYSGLHYDLHNLFGLYETVATNFALKKLTGKRPFIVSRSTYPGQGHFGSHWSGDVYSSWDHLRYSIPNMLEYNIYGTPMVGSDICGFNDNTTVELCMRWSALGAFYPFSRNHNSDDTTEQDPVALGPRVVAAAKFALELRYSLIPYLYYLFFKANTQGDTVARPLFFEFPLDENVYSIESQFLWGSAIMIVPILEPNTNQVEAYFPKGLWYDYATLKPFIKSSGQVKRLTIDDDKIGVFLRAGSIVPQAQPSMTTTEARKKKLNLIVAPDEDGLAKGEIFWDDGESIDNIERGNYTLVRCIYSKNLNCTAIKSNFGNDLKLGNIIIPGVNPKMVSLNGHSCIHQFDEKNSVLTITLPDNLTITEDFNISIE